MRGWFIIERAHGFNSRFALITGTWPPRNLACFSPTNGGNATLPARAHMRIILFPLVQSTRDRRITANNSQTHLPRSLSGNGEYSPRAKHVLITLWLCRRTWEYIIFFFFQSLCFFLFISLSRHLAVWSSETREYISGEFPFNSGRLYTKNLDLISRFVR